MIRFAKSSLLLAVLSITCWAQFKVTGIVPTKNHPASTPAQKPSTTAPNPVPFNGIQYNGGPVLNDPHGMNVYYIWYGDWSNDPAAQTILTDFIKHIGGTAYFNINTSYYDYNPGGEKDPVVNRVNYGGSITDNYSFGTNLTTDDLGFIASNPVVAGKLPADPNGVYFILSSGDVNVTLTGYPSLGFCTAFCAGHGDQTVSLRNVNSLVVAWAGNPNQCSAQGISPLVCAEQSTTPNNDFVADSMANVIAHELAESATDPHGTAWINPDGGENGDLCEWMFGKTKLLPNDSFYNAKFGGRPWLIQQIWVNARGGYCALALDE